MTNLIPTYVVVPSEGRECLLWVIASVASGFIGWLAAEVRDRRRPKLTDAMRSMGDPEGSA